MKPYSFPEMSTGEAAPEKMKEDTETVFTRIFRDHTQAFAGSNLPEDDASENMNLDTTRLEEQAYLKGLEKGEKEGQKKAQRGGVGLRVNYLVPRYNHSGIKFIKGKMIILCNMAL